MRFPGTRPDRARLAAAGRTALVLLWGVTIPLAVGCGKNDAELPDADQAVQIFRELHTRIYGAFSEPTENAVYDALSESVEGELLEKIYREIYGSLVAKEHGGVISEILEVTPIETEVVVEPKPNADGVPQFQVRAVWEVSSVASHEGHTHLRSHQYEALYLLALIGEHWRIVDDRMLRQRRLGEAWETRND